MIDLSRVEGFNWDKGNIDKNWYKHRVDYKECEEIFINQPLLINFDKRHSKKEQRFQALGRTNKGRKLFVALAIRGKKIRIISARDQSRKERRQYEEI